MHLKDLIGTDCYIECENAEQVKMVCGKLTAIGSKQLDESIDEKDIFVGLYSKDLGGGHMPISNKGFYSFRRYSFSDLSDFKESTKTN